jgi:prenyltransferase beta subunit
VVCGELQHATQSWLSKEKTRGYVRRCQRAADGGFRSAPTVNDVGVRLTYAALIALQLLCAPFRFDTQPELSDVLRRSMSFVRRC